MKRLISLILVSLLALLPAAAFCDEVDTVLQAQKSITVLGSAKLRVDPDCADLCLGVDTYDAQFSVAFQKNNDIIQAVTGALAALGADAYTMVMTDREITIINGSSENATSPARIRGYRVIQSFIIHVNDTALMGEALGKALDAGATTVFSITLGCSDAIAAHDEALALAIQDAARKAELMAAKSNAAVGEVLNVTEKAEEAVGTGKNATTPSYYGLKKMKTDAEDMSQWTDLMADVLEFSAAVVVTFQLNEIQ